MQAAQTVRTTDYLYVDFRVIGTSSQAAYGFAFMQGGRVPTSNDIQAGEYLPTGPNKKPAARIAIGPNGFALTPGRWAVHISIVDGDIDILEPVGFVTITT